MVNLLYTKLYTLMVKEMDGICGIERVIIKFMEQTIETKKKKHQVQKCKRQNTRKKYNLKKE